MDRKLSNSLDVVDRLAKKLKMRRHQIGMRVGSLSSAAALANDWDQGRISLEEVRRTIDAERNGFVSCE